MSVCEILSNLWLGNIVSAKNSRFFIENNINVVVNCSKDLSFYHNNTKNYRISIHDNLHRHIASWSPLTLPNR